MIKLISRTMYLVRKELEVKTTRLKSNLSRFSQNFYFTFSQDDPVPAREPKKPITTTSGVGLEGEGREGRKVRTVAPGEDAGAHGGSPALSRRASDIRPGAGGGKHFIIFISSKVFYAPSKGVIKTKLYQAN
jgi:hypothetical protein